MNRRRLGLITIAAAAALAVPVSVLLTYNAQAAESLLSQGRPATASSVESSSLGAAKAFDGNGSTRWASAEGSDPQWLRVDLGSTASITHVKLSWEAAFGKAYRIETSTDATTWTTIFSTTTGNGGTDDLTGLAGNGRYVQLFGTARGTSFGYSLFEMQVFGGGGTPAPTTPAATPPAPTTGPPTPPPNGPQVPFGSHLFPYRPGTLRPTGSQSTLDSAVVDYYNRWKAAFIRHNCGNGWYQVISPDADHPYVAEGQGYGMVIVATMAGADPAAKTIFDGMVKFMLAHPSVNNHDLLAAEQDSACRSVNGSDSATDGDLDVAYGLLLADRQWGSSGTFNYKQLAVRHINAIKASEVNASTHLLLLGDWSGNGEPHHFMTRPSDFMIDHFRAFRAATGDSAWDTIRTAHENLIADLQTRFAPNTGLLPDFVVNTNTSPKPAPGEVLEDPNDGNYFWNSCRVPWRIGADAVTSGAGTTVTAARKLNSWVRSKTGGDPNKIAVGYKLNGTQISGGSEPAFFAPFAVAAMTDAGSQAWLDALWNKMLRTSFGSTDYFSTSIQLQVMILASGNYWVP